MKYLKIMLLVAILSFYLISVSAFTFIRGDVDGNSRIELTDAVYILNYLFLGGSEPECLDAADTNDDSRININDAVFLLNYLFKGGKTLPSPYPERGMDSTWDDLDCGQISFKVITVDGGLSGHSLTGMNEEGKITALLRTDKPFPNSRIRPFLWEDNDFTDDQPGSMTDLLEFSRNPERGVITKVGINDKSQVVLTDQTQDGIPYIWQDNILTRLPMEDSLYEVLSVPDINNKGEIVGLVRNRITRDILVVFWNNNNFYPIGSRFPGSSLDIEINEESQILVNNEELRSEIWELDENFIVSKRTLLMNPDDSQKTNRAYSINNVGQVVGEFWVLIPPDSPLAVVCPQHPCALPRAFLWNEKEGMTRLDDNVLGHEQTRSSIARDLNDYGAIVGYTDPLGPDEDFGVIWMEGKQFRLSDLNNEGWKISHAYYINNKGWIAAEGYSEPGKASYLLLIPTNDPILG